MPRASARLSTTSRRSSNGSRLLRDGRGGFKNLRPLACQKADTLAAQHGIGISYATATKRHLLSDRERRKMKRASRSGPAHLLRSEPLSGGMGRRGAVREQARCARLSSAAVVARGRRPPVGHLTRFPRCSRTVRRSHRRGSERRQASSRREGCGGRSARRARRAKAGRPRVGSARHASADRRAGFRRRLGPS
jgi:hypothetical protein